MHASEDILVLTPSDRDSLAYAAPETELAKAYRDFPIVVVRTKDDGVYIVKGWLSSSKIKQLETAWKEEAIKEKMANDNTPVAKSDSVRNGDCVTSSDEGEEEDGALFDPDDLDWGPRAPRSINPAHAAAYLAGVDAALYSKGEETDHSSEWWTESRKQQMFEAIDNNGTHIVRLEGLKLRLDDGPENAWETDDPRRIQNALDALRNGSSFQPKMSESDFTIFDPRTTLIRFPPANWTQEPRKRFKEQHARTLEDKRQDALRSMHNINADKRTGSTPDKHDIYATALLRLERWREKHPLIRQFQVSRSVGNSPKWQVIAIQLPHISFHESDHDLGIAAHLVLAQLEEV